MDKVNQVDFSAFAPQYFSNPALALVQERERNVENQYLLDEADVNKKRKRTHLDCIRAIRGIIDVISNVYNLLLFNNLC